MTTDRELLGMAAKAAGIEMSGTIYRDGTWEPGISQSFKPASGIGACIDVTSWNPLEDDGDALRLAVRLHIDVCFGANYVIARGGTQMPIVNNADDPNAATRRAIVIEAAGIGRNMP